MEPEDEDAKLWLPSHAERGDNAGPLLAFLALLVPLLVAGACFYIALRQGHELACPAVCNSPARYEAKCTC